MTRFATCLEFVLAREGGRIDDPSDRGGRTAFGITQATYDAWRGPGASPADVWEISHATVAEIYRAKYWNACRCGSLPEGLDLAIFDAAVNHGPRKAIQFLQRATGIETDGLFGPQTERAVADDVDARGVASLVSRVIAARANFYTSIVSRDPTQARFSRGWANRLALLTNEIGVA